MDTTRNTSTETNEENKKGWSKLKTLDGASRLYTFSVLTTLALWIVTLHFDAEFTALDKDDDEDDVLLQKATPVHAFSAAASQIIRAFILLLLCIIIGACAFCLVAINVYPFERNQVLWQSWSLIASTISLVVTNVLVMLAMISSQQRYNEEKDDPNNYQSGFSHYLLLASLILSTLVMDLSFLAAFTENKLNLEEKEHQSHWSVVRNRLASLRRPTAEGTSPSRTRVNQQPSLRSRFRDRGVRALRWLGLRAIDLIAAIVEKIMELVGMKKPDNDRLTNISLLSSFSQDVSDAFLDIADFFVDSPPVQLFYYILTFLTWRAWRPWRSWMAKSRVIPEHPGIWNLLTQRFVTGLDIVVHWLKTFPERNRQWIDSWYDDIREDDQFEHSAWVLAAMCTSFVLLFYFGVKISSQVSGYLDEMYAPRRDCTVYSIENNGELGNFIFRLAGFTENSRNSGDAAVQIDDQTFTDIACTLPDLTTPVTIEGSIPTSNITAIDAQTIFEEAVTNASSISNPGQKGRFYRCSTNNYSENACFSLLMINELERNISRELGETITPIEVFKDHGIGRTIYVVDRMLRHTVWTVWIGLIVGFIVGVGSLLSVLAQYKRFSLAIRCGFFEDLHMSKNLVIFNDEEREAHVERLQDVVTEREWAKLIERYPMGSSVFFFGILVSTAVIQLVAFGSTVALLLSLIVSIFDARVFAILRPYMALLIAFLVTWLANGPIAQRLVCERFLVRKYNVLLELPFLAFLLVYTAVHLVLGVFFALLRLIWVMVTTIACLNRLDRNLFPILKFFDLGHRSFMAMVLMQHAFHSNAEEDEKLPFHVLINRLRAQPRPPMPPMPPMPSSSDSVQRPGTPKSPDVASLVQEAMSKQKTLKAQKTVSFPVEAESETVRIEMVPKEKSSSTSDVPLYLRDDFDQGGQSSQPPV